MKLLFINHHLFQEGDAYGLMYSLLLNRALQVGEQELHALFYVNADALRTDDAYKARIMKRMKDFQSFGLMHTRVHVVACAFSNSVPLVRVSAGGSYVRVRANKEIFKSNPRLVSLLLTGSENDPSRSLKEMGTGYLDAVSTPQLVSEEAARLKKKHPDAKPEDLDFLVARGLLAHYSGSFDNGVRKLLFPDYAKTRRRSPVEVDYAYIDKSTNYIASCVREQGFLTVTKVLRAAVLEATNSFTAAAHEFLTGFLGRLETAYEGKAQKSGRPLLTSTDSLNFLIVLFWIRGAKAEEREAMFEGGKGSVGKPQHHTNLTLYKYVRASVKILSESLGRPFLFVPIGDELKELTSDGAAYGYEKRNKAHNLIRFFDDPAFKGKPMGAQINFLLQLAADCPVVQVGMRSGSMERLMYLGVPTIYFDRTASIPDVPDPVGDSRIRQLCGFQHRKLDELREYFIQLTDFLDGEKALRTKGFPLFFHVENRDTGFLRYSDAPGTKAEGMLKKLFGSVEARERYNTLKQQLLERGAAARLLSSDRWDFDNSGALTELEARKLLAMLWYISSAYDAYSGLYRGLSAKVSFGGSEHQREFEDFKARKTADIERLRHQRANKDTQEVDFGGFDMFACPEDEEPGDAVQQ